STNSSITLTSTYPSADRWRAAPLLFPVRPARSRASKGVFLDLGEELAWNGEPESYIPSADLRLPDERPRLRAPVRFAGGCWVRACSRGHHRRHRRLQHLCGSGERRQPPVRQPRDRKSVV